MAHESWISKRQAHCGFFELQQTGAKSVVTLLRYYAELSSRPGRGLSSASAARGKSRRSQLTITARTQGSRSDMS